MPPYAYHIKKKVTWRGQEEEFENVYHYDFGIGVPTEAGFIDLLNAIRDIEKPLHAQTVTFLQGRAHGPTNGTQAEDQMRAVVDWSGQVGDSLNSNVIPFELAAVVSWYVGRSSRGYKRFLRKFWHVCGMQGTTGQGALGNTTIAAADKTKFTNAANNLKNIVIGGQGNALCTPQGSNLPAGTNPKVLDYLHTRQFRR